jgi:ribosome-interacting GTPase 1
MPANLTPDYLEAEREFRDAQTPADKLAALERMLATLPKHKGTEKLQADLRRKLSQTRKESTKKGVSHAAPIYLVHREGAGQVALIGPPNSGKSQIVCSLTHARPDVADYPFTTRVPTPGMMPFEDIQVQLVDLPPLSREFMEPWVPQALRNANRSVLVVDLSSDDLLDDVEWIAGQLDGWRLPFPALIAANKADLPASAGNLDVLRDLYGGRAPCVSISAVTGDNLQDFARAVFACLDVVRVYTRTPGRKAELGSPYVLRRGATVLDAARHVHKDFAEHLKYARLFHSTGGVDGLMVERSHLVNDRDILEFHI